MERERARESERERERARERQRDQRVVYAAGFYDVLYRITPRWPLLCNPPQNTQIHCTCSVVPSKVLLSPNDAEEQPQDPFSTLLTAFSFSPTRGERGSTVYQTEASILFCDVSLNPGESQTFEYVTTIPQEVPPTYRGNSISYVHKVTIGVQRVGDVSQQLKLPFRVLPIDKFLVRACRRESAYIQNDLAERRRESAVRFQQSCDFSAETPPPTPDVVTPRTMRPSPEIVYGTDTPDDVPNSAVKLRLDTKLAAVVADDSSIMAHNNGVVDDRGESDGGRGSTPVDAEAVEDAGGAGGGGGGSNGPTHTPSPRAPLFDPLVASGIALRPAGSPKTPTKALPSMSDSTHATPYGTPHGTPHGTPYGTPYETPAPQTPSTSHMQIRRHSSSEDFDELHRSPAGPAALPKSPKRADIGRLAPVVGVRTNPFCTKRSHQDFSRPTVLHAITSLSRRRKPQIFKIGCADKVAVKFHLSKPVYKIGEDVIGWFDFNGTTASCYQVTVTLETVEHIEDTHRVTPAGKNRSSVESGVITVHAKHLQFCRHLTTATIMLPIPLATTPQFSTGIVSVEWRLGFEFVLAAGDIDTFATINDSIPGSKRGDQLTVGPSAVPVETIKWNLPISVLPTHPSNLPSVNAVATKLI